MTWLWLCSLLGCPSVSLDFDVPPRQDPALAGRDCLVVDPDRVDLYEDFSGSSPTEHVALSNRCDGGIELQRPSIGDTAEPWELGRLEEEYLEANASTSLQVGLERAPPGGEYSTDLWLSYLGSTRVRVGLFATVVAATLVVTPDQWDFGAHYVGCEQRQPVVLRSAGTLDLEVRSLEMPGASSDQLFLDLYPERWGPLPWTIAPGDTRTIDLVYLPLDGTADEARLEQQSNDPSTREKVLEVKGHGKIFATQTDTFRQDDPPREQFELSQPPVAPTLAVVVSDEPVHEGWTYHPGAQAVRFDAQSQPPPGSWVGISYHLVADCGS